MNNVSHIDGCWHDRLLKYIGKQSAGEWDIEIDRVSEYSELMLLLFIPEGIRFGNQRERGYWYSPAGRQLSGQPIAVAYLRESAIDAVMAKLEEKHSQAITP